jgi:hypothetical protein
MKLIDLQKVEEACVELLGYIQDYHNAGKKHIDDPINRYTPNLPKESGMVKAQSLIVWRLLSKLRKVERYDDTREDWNTLSTSDKLNMLDYAQKQAQKHNIQFD